MASFENMIGRTILDFSQEEIAQLRELLDEQRNSRPELFNTSQTHTWDPIMEDSDRIEIQDNESSMQQLNSSSPYEKNIRVGNNKWCICGNCVAMPSAPECVCCKEIENVIQIIPDASSCITEEPYVDINLIDENHLLHLHQYAASFKKMRLPKPQDMTDRYYRKIAYRAFTVWIYGYLGPKNRKAIPACVVAKIRQRFPAPEEVYMGFIDVDNEGPASEMLLE